MLCELKVATAERNQFKDITCEVQKAVTSSGVKSGVCYIFVTHTTAGITINENADPDVRADMLMKLSELVQKDRRFSHSEGNSDAHIKASLMGFSVTVPVEKGKLLLGIWQGIYFCEFDGPRSRKVLIKIV